jgi:adenosylcobinamide-phosphate synthase
VLGGASLAAEAAGVSRALAAGDLDGARRRLPALCGRDPAGLSGAELARAAVESVAENTCDAVVAPLLWGAVAGVGGLLGYRAVNTLDAMVGHHTMRYERFGWAAARLDDVANLVPARVTAALAVTLAPAVGGSGRTAVRTVRRDGAAHPSPNAGRCEAAFAGALGISLGGTNVYQGRAERRGSLGAGPPPGPADIDRAILLSRLITAAATGLAAAAAHLLSTQARARGSGHRGQGRPARQPGSGSRRGGENRMLATGTAAGAA